MQRITSSTDSVVITPDSFSLRLDSRVSCLLQEYIKNRNLWDVFDKCVGKSRKKRRDQKYKVGRFQFDIRTRPKTDMCWIAPADEVTHQDLLRYLGSAGFGEVLESIGKVSLSGVKKLVIHEVTFIIVSSTKEIRWHTDFDVALAGSAWTVLLPLKLMDSSPPEMLLKNDETVHPYKYSINDALIFGPQTFHSTAPLCYEDGYRVMLSCSVGYINANNVCKFMLDLTAKYPPRQKEPLLKVSRSPHWRSNTPTMSYLPKLDDVVLLGREWLDKFNQLVEYKEKHGHCFVVKTESLSLKSWVSDQRVFYNARILGKNNVKARNMTIGRLEKLRGINFPFGSTRSEGRAQLRWMEMYGKLLSFYHKHGHCVVTSSNCSNMRLLNWIRTQRNLLGKGRGLNEATHKNRKQKLDEIGFAW